MYPAPALRSRVSCFAAIRQFIAVATAFLTIVLIIKTVQYQPACTLILKALRVVSGWMEYYHGWDAKKIMETGMPVLNTSNFEGDNGDFAARQVILDGIGAVTRLNLHSPAGVLQSVIPILGYYETPAAKATALPVQPPGDVAALPGDCLVAIYNTHTGETYGLTDGVERLDGRTGGVVTVAAALQEELENKYGIKTVRSERINDADYDLSYIESEKTARELLAANPKTMVILDIHRDSGKTREQSIVTINGEVAAPILFIVGSGARRPSPNWRQNQAFAQELSSKINSMYPGLSLGVRVKDGLYNQYLHPHALLVEVGTTKNSTEEAARSARFLATALAAVLGQQTAR